MNTEQISYTKMTTGQYELHILIESTSGLSIDRQSDIDALISIKTYGQTQYTKVKNNVGYQETFWGEHFFFNSHFDNSKVASGQRLVLQVWDYNRILKNSLVGSYQLDINRIYSQKDHCLLHTWLALSNINEEFDTITGYIKISVVVIGESDKAIQLSVEPIASITKQKKVLMPPTITRKSYQLIVSIYSAENIKPADGSTVDAYIGVQFGQIFAKTEPVMKNCSPQFNMRVYVPIHLPAAIENIAFRINDFNFIAKIEVIGSLYMNINKLIGRIDGDYKEIDQWVNFYGPQLQNQYDQEKNIYQFFPDLAPAYVGSLHIKVHIQQNDNPQTKSQPIQGKSPIKAPYIFYKFHALITAGLNLYNRNKKYKICMRVGVEEVYTDWAKAQNGFCLWQIKASLSIRLYSNQPCPDVFIYLVDHNNLKVCYLRYSAKLGIILDDQWVSFKPDLANIRLQNEEAGYLKIGLQMEKAQAKEPVSLRRFPSEMARVAEGKAKNGRVIIQLISAEALIPLDEDGGSDPFFTFSFMHSEVTSSKKEDTLNPVFFEKLVIEAAVSGQQGCPPIIINAFDQDQFSKDFIGSAFVDVGQAMRKGSLVYGMQGHPTPSWIQLRQNKMIAGRVLVGFTLLMKETSKIPKQINIASRKYNISLFILGLRNMKTTGLISIKKPYIHFDYENLNVYGKSSDNLNKDVITQPKQQGSSVNIKTVNQTTIVLPNDPSYWPSLNGKVYDYILGGIYQPILGYYSINLRDCYRRSKKIKQDLLREGKAPKKQAPIEHRDCPHLKSTHKHILLPLRNFVLKCLHYKWPILSPKIALNKIKNTNKKINESTIVVLPYYKQYTKGSYREQYKQRIRQNGEYMCIGYDKKEYRGKRLQKRNKHYRLFLDESYEEYYQRVNGIKMGIYEQIEIRKGRIFPSNDIASSMIRKISIEDGIVGTYKGNCYIEEYKQMPTRQDKLFKQRAQLNLRNFMSNQKVYLYLYIIQGASIPIKDQFSLSDPYLVVKLGKHQINLKDRYIEDTINPQFNQKINTIQIQVWDYDPIKNDQLIGSAIINIQNRVFAQFGSVSGNNPIQTHKLTAKQSRMQQGLIRFWMDLIPSDQISLYRQIDINKKQDSQFELRVIVWGCSGMPNNDIEDMNDLFVTCTFNEQQLQTDTHYRSSTGQGTFNWRMVYKMKLPINNPTITFKVYDKDIITFSDYISSGTFSIQDYLQQAFESEVGVKLYLSQLDLNQNTSQTHSSYKIIDGKKMYDRFEVQLINKINQDQLNLFGKAVNKVGKVQISIEILPKNLALKNTVGQGRSQPNRCPFLPQPKDRFQWSWNPLTLFARLCGPNFRYKVCCVLIIIIIILLFYNFGFSFVGSLVANITN